MELVPTNQPKKRTMSVKEIAHAFNCAEITIRKRVKELFPHIVENGKETLLDEVQVTVLKFELDRNQHLISAYKVEENNTSTSIQIPKTDLEKELLIAQAMQFQNDKILSLQNQLAIAAPKVDFYDAVTESSDTIDIGLVSKTLNMSIGRNNLMKLLKECGILMKNNTPYQRFVDAGYFRVVESRFSKPDGKVYIRLKTVVYQKGVDYIRKLLLKVATK